MPEKQSLEFRTPGTILSDALRQRPAPADAELPGALRSMSDNPGYRTAYVDAQRRAYGKLLDLLGVGLLAGGAVGLRHVSKLKNVRKNLHEIEHPEEIEKQATSPIYEWLGSTLKSIGGGVKDLMTTPQLDRGRFPTWQAGVLGLPPGSALALAGLLPAAGIVAGDAAMDKLTDAERKRLLDERKKRMTAEFERLLAERPGKAASASDEFVECLALLSEKAAAEKNTPYSESAGPGIAGSATMQTWWALSSALAFLMGKKLRESRDPGVAQQKALERALHLQRASRPVTIQMDPVARSTSRASTYRPMMYAVPYPDVDREEEPEVKAADLKTMFGNLWDKNPASAFTDVAKKQYGAVRGVWDTASGAWGAAKDLQQYKPYLDEFKKVMSETGLQSKSPKEFGDALRKGVGVYKTWAPVAQGATDMMSGIKDFGTQMFGGAGPDIQRAWGSSPLGRDVQGLMGNLKTLFTPSAV